MRLSLLFFALSAAVAQDGYVGSKACIRCHVQVAKTYAATSMAQASGRVSNLQLPPGDIPARNAEALYSVRIRDGKPQLHFAKKMPDGTQIEGSKTLAFYLGSGTHGRGFIFVEQGRPFQSPVAFYGPQRGWDLAPGYESENKIYISRKVETGCLNCHASGLTGTPELFEEGSVSCERCHGPGARHIAAIQAGQKDIAGSIVNPAKLTPETRDSVCAQCHLTGEARVLKPGKSDTSFRAGDRLADHVVPFVWATPNRAELKVIGHFEGLWQSKCKLAAGDRISCLTCHDPHTSVPAAAKDAFYRQKCLGCHTAADCKAPALTRQAKADSCTACHMQTRSSTDGQHTSFTDHSISRFSNLAQTAAHSQELTPFWPESATARDEALAYAQEAWLQKTGASLLKAHTKLRDAWEHSPGDPALAAELAYTLDLGGEPGKAEELYRLALKADPDQLLALTNLGTHLARAGDLAGAAEFWRKALIVDPGLLAPGLNLAKAQESSGQVPSALETLRHVLSLNPGNPAAIALEKQLSQPFANVGR